jgi:hypothetical protein
MIKGFWMRAHERYLQDNERSQLPRPAIEVSRSERVLRRRPTAALLN